MLRKNKNRFIIIAALIVVILVSMQIVFAHGSMSDPISRVYHCYLEGPETPDSVVCSDVIESSGTQPIYDWNEINLSNAGGNHQALIPDGQLCSAGREKYAAFDEPRTDWPRTIMPDSGPYTFLYSAYVPHNNGYFELWVTKDGYDPTVPLKWSDIEQFAVVDRPPVVDGNYVMTVDLPAGKSGHHVIYSIWQRNDSPEAFYACSDVWFGSSPTPTPTTAPACTAPAWNASLGYDADDVVSHNGAVWRARWGNSGNEPSSSSEPWRIREYCSSDGSVTPVPTTPATAVPTDEPTAVPTDVPTNVPTTVPTATTPPGGTSDCQVDYVIVNEWNNGFQADVTVTNNSDSAINGYTLTWTHAPGQVVSSGWNVTATQVGNDVTAINPAGTWMGMLGANGGSGSFGFAGTLTNPAVVPTDFVLNGVACNGDAPQPTATSVPPTATTAPPTATAVPPTATNVPPTATSIPPTATAVPPTATSIPPTATSQPTGDCSVNYVIANDWGSGFTANVTISNNGSSAISGWNLDFTFPGNQSITNAWNGTASQSGQSVSTGDVGWNSNLAANGGTASFGFNANYSGSNSAPTQFTLNGTVCN